MGKINQIIIYYLSVNYIKWFQQKKFGFFKFRVLSVRPLLTTAMMLMRHSLRNPYPVLNWGKWEEGRAGSVKMVQNLFRTMFPLPKDAILVSLWYSLLTSVYPYYLCWGTNISNQVVGWPGCWTIPLFSVWLIKSQRENNDSNKIKCDHLAANTALLRMTQKFYCIPPYEDINDFNQVGCDRSSNWCHFIWVNKYNPWLSIKSIYIRKPNVCVLIKILLRPK